MGTYQDALRIAKLEVERDQIEAEIRELKDRFRDGSTQAYVDTSNAGGPPIIVKITPNKRLDDKLARETLDEDTYNMVSKQALDTAKARAFLPADTIEKITRVYDNKVEVQVQ